MLRNDSAASRKGCGFIGADAMQTKLPNLIQNYADAKEKLGALKSEWEDTLGDELAEPAAYRAVKKQEKVAAACWARICNVLGIG